MYLVLLWVSSIAVAAAAAKEHPWFGPLLVLNLVGAVASSALKVQLPGVTGTLSVNFVFVLTAMADLPLSQAMIVGWSAAISQSLLWARGRTAPVHVAFNLGNITLSIAEIGRAHV